MALIGQAIRVFGTRIKLFSGRSSRFFLCDKCGHGLWVGDAPIWSALPTDWLNTSRFCGIRYKNSDVLVVVKHGLRFRNWVMVPMPFFDGGKSDKTFVKVLYDCTRKFGAMDVML